MLTTKSSQTDTIMSESPTLIEELLCQVLSESAAAIILKSEFVGLLNQREVKDPSHFCPLLEISEERA